MKSQKYILVFCTLFFLGCSSDGSDNSSPISGEEEPMPEPIVYEDINQSNITLDITQIFIAGGNIGSSGKGIVANDDNTTDFVPKGLSFAWIREEHFDGSTPGFVEARKTLEIHSLVGQAKRISGDGDIEVVAIGKNDSHIGNVIMTYVIDRDDDDLVPNGKLTLIKELQTTGGTYGTPLNAPRNYNSRQLSQLELEFSLLEGTIATSPDGKEVQSIKFNINPGFSLPDGLYNYNYNYNDTVDLFEKYNNTLDIYTMEGTATVDVPVNISQVHIGDGVTDNLSLTQHYQFGD